MKPEKNDSQRQRGTTAFMCKTVLQLCETIQDLNACMGKDIEVLHRLYFVNKFSVSHKETETLLMQGSTIK